MSAKSRPFGITKLSKILELSKSIVRNLGNRIKLLQTSSEQFLSAPLPDKGRLPQNCIERTNYHDRLRMQFFAGDGLMRATPAPSKRGFGYKKAGVVISKLIPESGVVRSLFSDTAAIERESKLSSVMDAINHTFGRGAVKMGIQGSGRIKSSSESQSPHYTTLWSDIPKVSVK